MVSFLGLMDTIKFKPKVERSKELIMTQYMLKMLTILTNILVSNLIELGQKSRDLDVPGFINELVASLTQKRCPQIKLSLNALSGALVDAQESDCIEKKAFNYGCSLLKELAFKFLTYTQDEVTDTMLKTLLLAEYATIINSQAKANLFYQEICALSKPVGLQGTTTAANS